MPDYTLPEQSAISTQVNTLKTNDLLELDRTYPSLVVLAATPTGQRVTVEFYWLKNSMGVVSRATRATFLDGSVCNVPVSVMLFGTGEVYLATKRMPLSTSFVGLADIPDGATAAVIQCDAEVMVNTDKGLTGIVATKGQGIEIKSRAELLATQIRFTTNSASGQAYIQYYLRY